MEAIPAAQAHSKGVGHVVPRASTGRGFSLHAPSWDEFDHARLHVDFQSAELRIPILFHNDFTESRVGCTPVVRSTCGLVAMASASQAEGQKFDLAKCMFFCCQEGMLSAHLPRKHISKAMARNGKHFLLVHKLKTTKGRRGRRKQQRAGEAAENDKGQESL